MKEVWAWLHSFCRCCCHGQSWSKYAQKSLWCAEEPVLWFCSPYWCAVAFQRGWNSIVKASSQMGFVPLLLLGSCISVGIKKNVCVNPPTNIKRLACYVCWCWAGGGCPTRGCCLLLQLVHKLLFLYTKSLLVSQSFNETGSCRYVRHHFQTGTGDQGDLITVFQYLKEDGDFFLTRSPMEKMREDGYRWGDSH